MHGLSKALKDFIKNSKWIFAKTYAETWPHHYIVRDMVDEALFIKMVKHIRQFGYEALSTTRNTYTSKKTDMSIGLWVHPSKKRPSSTDVQRKTPMNID
jgi:hypothetical protein